MPYLFILLFSSAFLLMFKLANLSVRLSDTNVYFYTAQQLLRGRLLYKDFFFTNFPLFPYISSFYSFISGGSIEFFYITSVLEVIATAVVLFLIFKKQLHNELVAFLGSITYLFSFIILITTDHQTGVFLVALFGTVAYYFYVSKKPVLSGIFIGFALCTKAYFLPVAVAFFVYTIVKERKYFWKLLLGTAASAFIILLPTLILTPREFLQSLGYSLTRFQGLDKLPIFIFFIKRDLLLFAFFVYSLTLYKRNLLLFLISLFSFIFLLFYRDLYYLYINFTIPFVVMSGVEFYQRHILKKVKLHAVVTILIITIALMNCYWYVSQFSQLEKVTEFSTLVSVIKNEHPDFLYGEEELTTALAYATKTPMLNNIVDTNASIFRKGLLSAKVLTAKALHSRTIIVTHGAIYPELKFNEPVISEVMNVREVMNQCKILYSSPVKAEGSINRITVLKCY